MVVSTEVAGACGIDAITAISHLYRWVVEKLCGACTKSETPNETLQLMN
jgi:hypothetical protein